MKGTTKVTLIRAALAIDGRWAIGRVPSTSDEIQLPTVVDPRDGTPRPYVPATGLAGSLRRHLGDELATTWLGPEPPDWEEAEASGKARERVASRLVLVGTSLDWAGVNTRVEHRGVTSVDPERRAAHRGGLRTEEWNHPVTVTLAMTHEDEADATLLDALESWTPTVGRASSTGMGAAHIKRVEHLTLDLRDANEFTWWLNQRNLWLLGADTEALPATARSTVVDVDDKPRSGASWSIGWEVREPLHIGSGDNSPAEPTSGSQVQHTMTVGGKPLIPGSSWKGVVRGRVETILSLIDAPRKSELINHLFGSTQHGRGLLGFEDSVVEPNSIPGGKLQNRTHVAIDRFTGGRTRRRPVRRRGRAGKDATHADHSERPPASRTRPQPAASCVPGHQRRSHRGRRHGHARIRGIAACDKVRRGTGGKTCPHRHSRPGGTARCSD